MRSFWCEYFGEERDDLVYLEGNLFDSTPAIKRINFKNNQFQFVGANILKSLNFLSDADMTGAGCISTYAANNQEIVELKVNLKENCGFEKYRNIQEEKIHKLEEDLGDCEIRG